MAFALIPALLCLFLFVLQSSRFYLVGASVLGSLRKVGQVKYVLEFCI